MAYNNGFPINYGYQMPMTQQMVQQPIQQPVPQQNTSMVWVQGEAGAKSYLLTPNYTLPLWDSEAQVIYLKSTDASGMPSMKILDYTIRDANNAPKTPLNDKEIEYVTKDELTAFKEEITKKFNDIKEGMGA